MKKEEFLHKLQSKIDMFTKEEQNKIIEEYKEKIKEDKDIENFESITEIQKKLLLSHGINPEKVLKKGISKKLEELFQVIRRVVDVMSKNEMKENAKIILDLIVLLFLICLIKLPFLFVENIAESLLLPLNLPYLITIMSVILDIIYIIIAIMVFINIFTKWFKNLQIKEKTPKVEEKIITKPDIKLKGDSLEAISLENNEDSQNLS